MSQGKNSSGKYVTVVSLAMILINSACDSGFAQKFLILKLVNSFLLAYNIYYVTSQE